MTQRLRETGIVAILIVAASVAYHEALDVVHRARKSPETFDASPYTVLRERFSETPRIVFAYDDSAARSRAYAAQYALAPTAVLPFPPKHAMVILLHLERGLPILVHYSKPAARAKMLETLQGHSRRSGFEIRSDDVGDSAVVVQRTG